MAANMKLTIFINVLFAGVIAFGVVYNTARVSLSERSRELASLRVLGFTRAEISLDAAGRAGRADRRGAAGGRRASATCSSPPSWSPSQSEIYRFPSVVSRQAVAWACLGILGAAMASGAARAAASRPAGSGGGAEDARMMRPRWKHVRMAASVLAVGGDRSRWRCGPRPSAVDLARPCAGRCEVTLDEDGETRVRERFVVSAPVAGRLQRIELEPGDARRQGPHRGGPAGSCRAAATRSARARRVRRRGGGGHGRRGSGTRRTRPRGGGAGARAGARCAASRRSARRARCRATNSSPRRPR